MAKAVQEDRSLSLVPLSQLPERSVGWLWRGRLAFGKLAILDGDPGMGKTRLALDICVRATTGKAFPGDVPAVGPVNVMLLNAEDAMEDTIKPRLRAMGADLDRVFAIDEEKYDLSQPVRFPADRDVLDKELARTQARFLVIDPIVAFLERGIQSSNDQSVRRALLPLAKLARKHQCAILLIRHLNKRGDLRSLYRGGGSIGFVGSCRTAWLVAADEQHAGQRVLAQVKNNLAPPQPSLAYRIEEVEGNKPTLTWLGESALQAEQLLAGQPKEEVPLQQRELARDWLEDLLDEGPKLTTEIFQAAQQAGLSERTLFRARGDLKIATKRLKLNGKRTNYWLLPFQSLPRELEMAAAQEETRDFMQRLMNRHPPGQPLNEQEPGSSKKREGGGTAG